VFQVFSVSAFPISAFYFPLQPGQLFCVVLHPNGNVLHDPTDIASIIKRLRRWKPDRQKSYVAGEFPD
jgi:hypothetical protein